MIITLIRFKSKIKTKTWFLFQNNYLLILSRLHTFRFVMNHIRSAKRTLVLVPPTPPIKTIVFLYLSFRTAGTFSDLSSNTLF